MHNNDRPLRVMHIISGDLWAGAEVQAYTLLSHLRERCELYVVLMNPGKLADELAVAGIATLIIDERRVGGVGILRRLRQAMRAFDPDVVHTHRQKENILGSLANVLANFPGRRAVCVRTSHGASEFAPKGVQRIQVALDLICARYFQQAVIAVSGDLKIQLGHQLPSAKIHLIRNGVDAAQLRAQAQPADFRQQWPAHTHVGIAGRIESVKRIDIFLAMAPLVIAALPDAPLMFHVIGDGRLKADMQILAGRLGILDRVVFHGHRSDMPSCIDSLDVLVMCSDHEGTPMTVLEALALETPVLAHRVGGLAEVLAVYPRCLVEDHSPEGYAQALVQLLQGPLPEVGLPREYLAQTCADSTLTLYQHLTRDRLSRS